MPKRDKLLEELKSLPTDMSFADLEKILVDLGWDIRDTGKSHVIVQSPRGAPFTIVRKPQHRVKRVYLRLILKEIDTNEG